MEKLYRHIEKLLGCHDYVVTPGLGGFVVQRHVARVLPDRIVPPLASISFNPLMQHADGLLAIEIAREEGITYRQAAEIINAGVSEIKKRLEEQGELQFGNLGFFRTTPENTLFFTPFTQLSFLPENLGQTELFISERAAIESLKGKRQVFTLRTYKYAAAAAVIFGMLLVSPAVNDVKQPQNAGLLSSITNTLRSVSEAEENAALPASPQNGCIENETAVYNVIVAGLGTKAAAENYCEYLKNNHFDETYILSPAKLFLVSVKSFNNRDEAIEYMETLRRSDKQFESAWVFCR